MTLFSLLGGVCLAEVLGGAVEVPGCIHEVVVLVVPQEMLLPDLPATGICHLRDGSVEEGNRGTTVIVIRHPGNGLVDTVVIDIQETVTQSIRG